MLRSFTQYITEVRGFSTEVEEYSNLCIEQVNAVLDKYLSYNLSKGYFNFSEDIVIQDSATKVSQEASGKFPIDEIRILFKIAAVTQEEFQPYSAYYRRNYDKVKIYLDKEKGVDLVIMCRLVVPKKGDVLDRELVNSHLRDVFNHELLHAYNDYKDPNFLKGYRLGIAREYVAQAYPYLMKSSVLRRFFDLLYVLTDEEIRAIVGERKSFKDIEELREFNGYRYSVLAREYDPDEYAEAISAQLEESEYLEYIKQRFGEFFLSIYREAGSERDYQVDPKILKIKPDSTLEEVLYFFEPYIKQQGKKLWRKLAAKIS